MLTISLTAERKNTRTSNSRRLPHPKTFCIFTIRTWAMKKRAIEIIVFLVVAMIGAWILPSFFSLSKTIEFPPIDDFIITSLIIFAVLFAVTMSFKRIDREPKLSDGFHELYNAKKQLTKKGMFFNGKQVSGTKHVYKKDGTLSHIEKCVDGVYTSNIIS
jgi:hypothetical protein